MSDLQDIKLCKAKLGVLSVILRWNFILSLREI